jgi:hypothetical protein
VQSLIEQEPTISAQLSLWRQRGTVVDLGRLRIVPLDSTLLYVRPLFLTARDQEGAIPQLQRVIASDGENVAMAETLAAAITQLYAGSRTPAGEPAAPSAPPPGAAANWPVEALQLYEEAQARLRDGDFAGFGAVWARLRETLERAARQGATP